MCYRAATWHHERKSTNTTCYGRYIRSVCNLSKRDLDKIRAEPRKSGCLLANKFNLDVDPSAPLCLVKERYKKLEK